MRHVAPILAFGSWGWIWGSTTMSRIDSAVHEMARSIMGRGRPEEEWWLSWHTRTLWDARHWVVGRLGRTFTKCLLKHGATEWDEWLQWHETIFIRRLIGRQSVAHYEWAATFVQHVGKRGAIGTESVPVGHRDGARRERSLLGGLIGCVQHPATDRRPLEGVGRRAA